MDTFIFQFNNFLKFLNNGFSFLINQLLMRVLNEKQF